MTIPLPTLEELLRTITTIETALGDKTKINEFIARYGETVGPKEYEAWRTSARTKLQATTALYRQAKTIAREERRKLPIVQLLDRVWRTLADYPEQAELREQIRLFVRKEYNIFLLSNSKRKKTNRSRDETG
jgi:hypothetical protein